MTFGAISFALGPPRAGSRFFIRNHPVASLFDLFHRFLKSNKTKQIVKDVMMKRILQDRLTTVFPRQGHYALDPRKLAAYPPADLAIERIGDLLNCDLPALFGLAKAVDGESETP